MSWKEVKAISHLKEIVHLFTKEIKHLILYHFINYFSMLIKKSLTYIIITLRIIFKSRFSTAKMQPRTPILMRTTTRFHCLWLHSKKARPLPLFIYHKWSSFLVGCHKVSMFVFRSWRSTRWPPRASRTGSQRSGRWRPTTATTISRKIYQTLKTFLNNTILIFTPLAPHLF